MNGFFDEFKEFGRQCGERGEWRHRGRWGFEGFMGDFWGPPGARGRGAWRARAGRVFEQGDLKYVILRLLAEKPRHGYEIIKELEERFGGAYQRASQEAMGGMLGSGLAPDVVGQRVLRGMQSGEFYILTHATERDVVKARHARIEAAFDRAAAWAQEPRT